MELNKKQKEAVNSNKGPFLVLAGAGTGKTTVLTKRVKKLLEDGASPVSILALTFTNKATNEMMERIEEKDQKKPFISTFHSFCVKMMRTYPEYLPKFFDENFSIVLPSQSLKILKEINLQRDLDDKFDEKEIRRDLSYWKNRSYDERISAMSEYLMNIMISYQKKLRQNNSMDFDDLLNIFNKMLDDEPKLKQEVIQRFQYILVDEFQDTNVVQYEILKKILNNEKNIFVVGDPDQSIYKFRGAEQKNTTNFQNELKPKIIPLLENYRSTQKILNSSFELISHNSNRFTNEKLKGSKSSFMDVEKKLFDNNYQEVDYIVKRIKGTLEFDDDPEDFAVLVRSNFQTALFETTLKEKGIPYKVQGDLGFFQRREIQIIMPFLLYAVYPFNEYFFKEIVLQLKNGIGEKTLEKFNSVFSQNNNQEPIHKIIKNNLKLIPSRTRNSVEELIEKIENLDEMLSNQIPFEEFVSNILENFGIFDIISKMDEPDDRFENIEAFIVLGSEKIEALKTEELKKFLDDVSLESQGANEKQNKVILSTIHKAKGMEFKNVFIPLMTESFFPNSTKAPSTEDIEEERRVFYVGMTRAKKSLIVSAPKNIYKIGQLEEQEISRFFNEFELK